MAFIRSTLFNKVNFIDVSETRWLPCTFRSRLKRPHQLPSVNRTQYYMLLCTGSCKSHWHYHLPVARISCSARASHFESLRACKVKSEDSEEILSSENILIDEETLMQELQSAIEEENYARAAKIRDSLRLLQEDSKASILASNARFYNAFKKGDLAAMQALWARGDKVCCVHPGASGVLGYDDVMESWDVVWMNYDFPLEIELKNVVVHFRGDVGYVSCVEFVKTKGSSWGAQYVTNVFEKIDGQWFICIHHASPVDL